MAKMSKYQKMIGETISMSFADVTVTGYQRLDVVSKTGRKYKKYEVEIDNVVWVSTTSFNKQSFSKRYFKALKNVKVVKEDEPVKETPVTNDGIKEMVDDWYSDWRLKREIDDLHEASLVGKDMANQHFETISRLIKESKNMNVHGQTIWHTKKELFEFWYNHVVTKENERIKEELDNGNYETGFFYVWSYGVATLNEWKTEFSKKLWQFIQDEWSNLEERRHKAQQEWRDKVFGSDWQDRWERKNFGSIDMRVNKYDEVFKDLTPKEAKRKMRELSKRLHPDVHPELDGSEFKDMHSAYERHMARVA